MSRFAKVAVAFANLTLPYSAFAQNDPIPEPPKVAPSNAPGMVTQAGVGGKIAFGRAGVVELGGSLSASSADKYSEFTFAPSAGYFIIDNIELTGMINWRYGRVEGVDPQNIASIIFEPSFNMPISNVQFLFAGLGVGTLMQSDTEVGGAIAPRIGFKHLMGRSGMLTTDLRATFGLNRDEVQTISGTVLTVKSVYGIGVGYTVLL